MIWRSVSYCCPIAFKEKELGRKIIKIVGKKDSGKIEGFRVKSQIG